MTVDVSPIYGGIVEVNQNIPTSLPTSFSIASGESVRLKAVPSPDYEFASWNGSLSGTANPTAVIMDCNKSITANFNQILTPTIDNNDNGSTYPLTDNYSLPEGDELTVIIGPDSDLTSGSLIGGLTETESSDTTPTIDSSKSVSTSFEQVRLNWWLVYSIIAAVVIIVATVLLVFRYRTVSNK